MTRTGRSGMSQPRRRRRSRRRRSSGSSDQTKREAVEQARGGGDDQVAQQRSAKPRRSGRGRRGRTRARDARSASPKSSEDLVRGDPKRPPAQLTGEHDGTSLEQVIGELQSTWGVPQHPQEFRITLKVAEDRGDRAVATEERVDPESDTAADGDDKPKREKAPAAPRIGASAAQAEGAETTEKTTRKRRSRRRRRRSKGSGTS